MNFIHGGCAGAAGMHNTRNDLLQRDDWRTRRAKRNKEGMSLYELHTMKVKHRNRYESAEICKLHMVIYWKRSTREWLSFRVCQPWVCVSFWLPMLSISHESNSAKRSMHTAIPANDDDDDDDDNGFRRCKTKRYTNGRKRPKHIANKRICSRAPNKTRCSELKTSVREIKHAHGIANTKLNIYGCWQMVADNNLWK